MIRRFLAVSDTPAILLLSKVVGSVLTLCTAPIIARSLGPEGRGITAAVTAVVFLTPLVAGFGLPWVVRRWCATSADPHAVVRTARLLGMVSLVPTVVIALGVQLTIFSGLSFTELTMLHLSLAITPLVVSRNILISLLVVQGDYRKIALLTLAQPAFYVSAIVALFMLGSISVTTVIGSYGSSLLVTYVATVGLNSVPIKGPRVAYGPLAKESMKAVGAQIAEMSSYRLDLILILPLAGPSALGMYSVATNVAMAPSPAGNALGAACFNEIARSGEGHREKRLSDSFRYAVALGSCAGVVVAASAPVLVPIVFGSAFSPAVWTTVILSLGTLLIIVNQVVTSSLFAINKGLTVTTSQTFGVLVGLVLLFVLAPHFGANGAACAGISGYFVTAVIGVRGLQISSSGLLPRLSDFLDASRIMLRRSATSAGVRGSETDTSQR